MTSASSRRALLFEVRFVDGRYHGRHDWPPSPFRLFQALIAGAYGGRWATEPAEPKDAAFLWLERLDPPHIVAPKRAIGTPVTHFVPNNDLDTIGGDPGRVEEIRVRKHVETTLFDENASILYAWPFDDGEAEAATIAKLAERLHTLGAGIDAAFARAEAIPWPEAQERLAGHPGAIARPTGAAPRGPTCPTIGSLESLKRRYREGAQRFRPDGRGTLFANPGKARFREVSYDSPPVRLVFDLVAPDGAPCPWRLDRVVALTERVRDAVAARLEAAMILEAGLIHATIVGSRDAGEAEKASRIRIVPLPSIGQNADHAIRRILVEIPLVCPLASAEVNWAFSGLPVASDEGEMLCELAAGGDRGLFRHYGADSGATARRWRSVTPLALPMAAQRRRIDPLRIRDRTEQKDGQERAAENARAIGAVHAALRHANVAGKIREARVQCEPFEARGQRAEAFAPGTRFARERLWHVEIEFDEPQPGPLQIGDGRYLGLGLMRPVRRVEGVFAFQIAHGLAEKANPVALARALRRAVMARVQAQLGARATLPLYFTGHATTGAPANSSRHDHLAFAFDAPRKRLIVVAPHVLERRQARPTEHKSLATLENALDGFQELRAGEAGLLTLRPVPIEMREDPLFAPSRAWESLTAYRVTRHARLNNPAEALRADILVECLRGGLPRPDIKILDTFGRSGLGLFGNARLEFHQALHGPILIGRDRHFGGGMFKACLSG